MTPAAFQGTTARRNARSREAGYVLVALAIFLAVMGVAALATMRSSLSQASRSAGLNMGAILQQVATGVDQYRTANATTLTLATPVIAGFANPIAPTMAELKAAGYVSTNIQDTLAEGGAYNIRIQKNPAACTGPSAACNVWSEIWLTNPLIDPGTGRLDNNRLGALISQLTDAASFSQIGSAATITGGAGGWTIPNPDPTQRAGILVVVAGLGAPSYPYLNVRDTRNPDFQNLVSAISFNTPVQLVYGQPCTTNGSFGSGTNGIAFCSNNFWVPYSGQQGTAGAACAGVDGVVGQAANGAGLICIGGIWRDLVTYGFRGADYYAHNATVPKPVCGAGLLQRAAISTTSASVIIGINNPGNNTGSFQASIDPSTWLVTITGSDGSQAGANARALVTTFCSTS